MSFARLFPTGCSRTRLNTDHRKATLEMFVQLFTTFVWMPVRSVGEVRPKRLAEGAWEYFGGSLRLQVM
eukprot:2519667-Amphidinium_carterae.1